MHAEIQVLFYRNYSVDLEKQLKMKHLLDGKKFAAALKYGVETAYKAVMKPVEGTILTVAKDAANVGVEKAQQRMILLK